jgi:hypothetical protein
MEETTMDYYEIIVENQIDKKRFREFPNMTVTHILEGRTLISGNLEDQSQLFTIINKIRDMNLKLVLIKKDQQDLGGYYE